MKGSLLPVVTLLAATTFSLYGCGADDKQSITKTKVAPTQTKSLSVFLSLHKQYCESDMNSREALVTALKADARFKPASGFVGVFETKVDGVSYAVSPEIDGCTTDVMVKNAETGKLLFTYADMNKALTGSGYQIVGNETKRKDVGSDRKEVTILEKTFISPKGETTNLDYPADRPGQYYMTLFAKKFTKAKKASISMNN